jgi:hypothetical protein
MATSQTCCHLPGKLLNSAAECADRARIYIRGQFIQEIYSVRHEIAHRIAHKMAEGNPGFRQKFYLTVWQIRDQHRRSTEKESPPHNVHSSQGWNLNKIEHKYHQTLKM